MIDWCVSFPNTFPHRLTNRYLTLYSNPIDVVEKSHLFNIIYCMYKYNVDFWIFIIYYFLTILWFILLKCSNKMCKIRYDQIFREGVIPKPTLNFQCSAENFSFINIKIYVRRISNWKKNAWFWRYILYYILRHRSINVNSVWFHLTNFIIFSYICILNLIPSFFGISRFVLIILHHIIF